MEDYTNEIKMIENGLVITLLLIIIIILVPSFTKMIDKSMQLAAQTNTTNNIKMVKEMYIMSNLTDVVSLPFKVVYNNDGYKIYSNGKEYTKKGNIIVEKTRNLPSGGSIEIETNGNVIVKNLKFGKYKCNQINTKQPICEK
ncbi:MAG: hypothetical protein IKE90_00220 [Bacilli bacterium]|nr:hypothetical protein [Bacilli bacterium]